MGEEVGAIATTRVEIDENLLHAASEALGAASARAAVDQALREVVMRRGQAAALDGLAGLALDLHSDKLQPDPATG